MESSYASPSTSETYSKSTDLKMHHQNKTHMATATKLDQDDIGKCVDITSYRGMIDSLLYPDI